MKTPPTGPGPQPPYRSTTVTAHHGPRVRPRLAAQYHAETSQKLPPS